MTVSKESLLPEEGRKESSRTAVMNARQPERPEYPQKVNSIQIQQGTYEEELQDSVVPEIQLSHTISATDSYTLLLLHQSSTYDNDNIHSPRPSSYYCYYLEIPFAAIHGMQTRQRHQRKILEEYASQYAWNVGTVVSTADDPLEDSQHHQPHKAMPFATPQSFVDKLQSDGTLTTPLLIATLANSIPQFLVGYHLVVLNTIEPYIFQGHSSLEWSWAVSALAIAAPFGAMIGEQLSDSFGRKCALLFTGVVFLVGGILQATAPHLEVVALARLLLGLTSGISTTLVPLYLGELAPVALRGMLGTVNQFALVVGILVADVLSFLFANATQWRYLLGVAPVIALFQVLLMPWVVESPRHLLHRNPRDPQARVILRHLRGYTLSEDVEEEADTYVAVDTALRSPTPRISHPQNFDMETSSATIPVATTTANPNSLTWEMLTFPGIRFLFFCCIALHVGQQLCGVAAVFYYSTSLFADIMDNPLIGTTSIGAINVLFTYVALLLMDSCRRNTLLLWSIIGMAVSCVGLTLCQTGVIHGTGIPTLIFVNAYVAFYAVGMGPIPFLWIVEMIEPRYVALVMSICSQLNWVTNFVVGIAFPILREYLGGLAFVPFGVVLITTSFFVWLILPEKRPPSILQTPKPKPMSSKKGRRGLS